MQWDTSRGGGGMGCQHRIWGTVSYCSLHTVAGVAGGAGKEAEGVCPHRTWTWNGEALGAVGHERVGEHGFAGVSAKGCEPNREGCGGAGRGGGKAGPTACRTVTRESG
jgi:hypothetical protein